MPTIWSAPPSMASPRPAHRVRQQSHGAEIQPCRAAPSTSSSLWTSTDDRRRSIWPRSSAASVALALAGMWTARSAKRAALTGFAAAGAPVCLGVPFGVPALGVPLGVPALGVPFGVDTFATLTAGLPALGGILWCQLVDFFAWVAGPRRRHLHRRLVVPRRTRHICSYATGRYPCY